MSTGHAPGVDRDTVRNGRGIEQGHADQILLSHDVCLRSHLRAYGGGGYDYLLTDFLPRLQATGVSAETIRVITVDNPRRALTGGK